MENKTQFIKISENKRFLVKEDGTPFFWLGDTAWHLFHRLTKEEAEEYLNNRVELNFNVIQAVILAECDGLRTPNSYGRFPLFQNSDGEYDPTIPDLTGDYSYWDHIDYIIDKANDLGLYIGLLPTWGDKFNIYWGKGPVIFNVENARAYGKWLGERYRDRTNIIWILGGDRPPESDEHYSIIRGMAEGLIQGDKGNHPITYHPPGNKSSSEFLHQEDWLSFNMVQSGHNCKEVFNYKLIEKDYNMTPTKPVMESEPCYEEHTMTTNPEDGYYSDYEVRRAAYWGVFAGGFGHTYGHHAVWQMAAEASIHVRMGWRDAIKGAGARHMQYIRKLVESRSFFDRIPDQGLIVDEFSNLDHIRGTRGRDYAFIYTPTGIDFEVVMGRISGKKVTASWYDPRTGSYRPAGEFDNKGIVAFTPPKKNIDWVLVLEE